MDQRSRQRQALFHSARQRVDVGIRLVFEIDQCQEIGHDRRARRRPDVLGGGEELQILVGAQTLVNAEEVGHVTHVATYRQRVALGIEATDAYLAPVARQQRSDDQHRRGLAGPVGSDEAHDGPLRNLEVCLVERLDSPVAFGDPVELDDHCSLQSNLNRASVSCSSKNRSSSSVVARTTSSPVGEAAEVRSSVSPHSNPTNSFCNQS